MSSQKAACSRSGRANSTSDTRELHSQQYQTDWTSNQGQALGEELLNYAGQSCPEQTFTEAAGSPEPPVTVDSDMATSHKKLPTSSRKHQGLPSNVWRGSKPMPNPPPAIPAQSSPNNIAIPACSTFDPVVYNCLKTAMDEPPVTRATLVELDLTWIMHNINLRVDVNFDYDLHFMPIKGKRGDQKRKEAQNYWAALAAEFRIYQHQNNGCNMCRLQADSAEESCRRRLPKMFESLGELLKTLVPDRDHASVSDNLDVPLLMQQVENGALDTIRLSRWLANLLKSHCAPMRDEWADEMATKIEQGTLSGDASLLVSGLEKLFSFLEAMKLDVANHQIRTFRFLLIEDTISFQQGYFRKRIREGRMNPEPARLWYDNLRRDYCQSLSQAGQDPNLHPLKILLHGLLDSCASPLQEKALPETFSYNSVRMRQLREDIQDIIYLRVCSMIFRGLVCRLVCREITLPPESYSNLQRRILAIIDDDTDGNQEFNWRRSLEGLAMEITRSAYLLCRPSSFSIPDEEYQKIGQCLVTGFSDKDGPSACKVLSELEQVTWCHAQIFQNMSALSMSESQRQWQQERQVKKPFRPLPDIEDVARRLAHIGVLHWKIWAVLVYVKEDAESDQDDDDMVGGLQFSVNSLLPGGDRDCKMDLDILPQDDCEGVDGMNELRKN